MKLLNTNIMIYEQQNNTSCASAGDATAAAATAAATTAAALTICLPEMDVAPEVHLLLLLRQ